MTQPRSEPDGSQGRASLEQIRESERAVPSGDETSSAGRTEPIVAQDAEGDSAPGGTPPLIDQATPGGAKLSRDERGKRSDGGGPSR